MPERNFQQPSLHRVFDPEDELARIATLGLDFDTTFEENDEIPQGRRRRDHLRHEPENQQ